MRSRISLTVAAAFLSLLAGCGEEDTPVTTSATESSWILTDEPEGAVSIVQAKSDAKEGDQITLRGRIGGRKAPLSGESAVFTIIDMELPHCGQMGDEDHCPTPWDYCCETPEDLRANAATVQLVGDGGGAIDPIAGGLEALDEVVVVGTVGPRPSEEVLTIRATRVYKK